MRKNINETKRTESRKHLSAFRSHLSVRKIWSWVKISLFTFPLSVLVSCEQEDFLPQETDSDAVRISATIGALQTRVSYEDNGVTEFQPNDIIRVISYTRQGKSKNDAKYRFNGMDWEPVLSDKYVVWEGITDNTFYGVYPSDAEYENFKIPTDQSGGVQVADWMTDDVTANKSVGKVDFNFQHRLAKVTVNITNWNNEFTGTEEITEPKIYTKGTAVEVSYGTGTYGADEYTSDGTYTAITASATGQTYTAIVAPLKYGENDTFMTFTVAGQKMTVLAKNSTLTDGLESGKHYTFDLKVGKDKVTLIPTTNDSDFPGGWNTENNLN